MQIFQKTRRQEIQTLQLANFFCDAYNHLNSRYFNVNNRTIQLLLKILKNCWYWQLNEVENYRQLICDYSFWEFRNYYFKELKKFVRSESNAQDLIDTILYMSIELNQRRIELIKDYSRQENLDLDLKSFKFSKILIDLIPILEGYDADPEESFFTEEEFRTIIESSFEKIKKYLE